MTAIYSVMTQYSADDKLHCVIRREFPESAYWTVIRSWSVRKFPRDAYQLASNQAREMNRLSQLD